MRYSSRSSKHGPLPCSRNTVVRHWLIRVALALSIVFSVAMIPGGRRAVKRSIRLRKEFIELVRQNKTIAQENRLLSRRIRELKNDHQAIERIARDEMGLVQPGDIVYLFE